MVRVLEVLQSFGANSNSDVYVITVISKHLRSPGKLMVNYRLRLPAFALDSILCVLSNCIPFDVHPSGQSACVQGRVGMHAYCPRDSTRVRTEVAPAVSLL
jgi:hypothetical protein